MPDDLSVVELCARRYALHILSFRPQAQVAANNSRQHVSPYAVPIGSISVAIRTTSTTNAKNVSAKRILLAMLGNIVATATIGPCDEPELRRTSAEKI